MRVEVCCGQAIWCPGSGGDAPHRELRERRDLVAGRHRAGRICDTITLGHHRPRPVPRCCSARRRRESPLPPCIGGPISRPHPAPQATSSSIRHSGVEESLVQRLRTAPRVVASLALKGSIPRGPSSSRSKSEPAGPARLRAERPSATDRSCAERAPCPPPSSHRFDRRRVGSNQRAPRLTSDTSPTHGHVET